jgi:PAS domain S-box-containing protein
MMFERQLAELLEGTTDAAFTVDLQGEIRNWNKAAEQLLGHPATSAVGKDCGTLLRGRLDAGTPVCCQSCDVLECVRAGRDVSNFDMEITTRAGRRVWVNVSLLVTNDDHTERRLIVHMMRDIRRRKRAEQLTSEMFRIARSLVNNAEQSSEVPPIVPLTLKEIAVLRLLAGGRATTQVAEELQISTSTLRNHISHINQKLHTRNRTEAVMKALKRGVI